MLRNGLFGRHEKRLDIIYSTAFIRKAGKTGLGAAHIVVIEATFSCPTKELAVVCLFNFFSLIVFAFFSAFFLSPCEIMNEKEKWLIFALWKLSLSLPFSQPASVALSWYNEIALFSILFVIVGWFVTFTCCPLSIQMEHNQNNQRGSANLKANSTRFSESFSGSRLHNVNRK